MITSTRVRYLSISQELLLSWFTAGSRQFVSHGLPADTRLIGCTLSRDTGNLILFLQSDEFDPLPSVDDIVPPAAILMQFCPSARESSPSLN